MFSESHQQTAKSAQATRILLRVRECVNMQGTDSMSEINTIKKGVCYQISNEFLGIIGFSTWETFRRFLKKNGN